MTALSRRQLLRGGALAVGGLASAGSAAARSGRPGAVIEQFPFSGVPIVADGSTGVFSGEAHTVFKPMRDYTALIQLSFSHTGGEWLSGPLADTAFCAIEMNSAKTVALPGDDAVTTVTFRGLQNPCRGQRVAFEGPLTTHLDRAGALTLVRLDLAPRREDGRVVR